MSDFLSNLAARSQGTAEPIRPRVPSLFEPDRRREGQLRVRQETTETGASEQDAVERLNDGDLQESSLSSTVASQPDSQIHPRKSAPTPQSNSSQNLRPVLSDPTVQRETDPGKLGVYPAAKPLPKFTTEHVRPPRPVESKETLSISKETVNAVERNSDVSSGRFNPKGTETLSASTVRPTIRPRAEIASTPSTTVPAEHASESAVQITIGRVEVRAIFPEPSIRRTTPRHSKPAVSLDDYLKQRNR